MIDHPHPAADLRARAGVRALRSSKIRDVANAAMGKPGVLPFWFGEPDVPTPQEIRDVAIAELNAGNTFYTHGLGTPELRAALADYGQRLHGQGSVDRIAVTSSGTSALMVTIQSLITTGDRVVAVTPLWPNLVEMPKVYGASVETVSLDFGPAGWQLELDRLLAALTPGTKALLINSPNNPTSWALSSEEQRIILDHCRRYGIWIIADDVYERYYFDGSSAPSFLDVSDSDDRLVSTNSFSKTWLMTGWRIGWLTATPTADSRDLQADRVLHHLHPGLRPSRSPARRHPRRADRRRDGGATAYLSRSPGPLAGCPTPPPAGGAGARGHVQLLQAGRRHRQPRLLP